EGIDLFRDCISLNAVNCFISPKIDVYTSKGYKNIENVQVGDLVLTHRGRFRSVLSKIHDLPKEQRKNTGRLVRVKTKYKAYTVTEDHQFLSNDKWVKASQLKKGDLIKILGAECIQCGKVYNKRPHNYDNTLSVCSPACKNKIVSKRPEVRAAISKAMKKQYETGVRDRFTITTKANEEARKRVKEGIWHTDKMHNTCSIKKANKKRALVRQRYCSYSDRIISGFGERELSQYFDDNQIEYYHQYAVGERNFDFYLPSEKLLIEIENPKAYNIQKEKRYEKRKQIAKRLKLDLVFISSENGIAEIKRILKNHSGEYYFTDTEVLDIEIKNPKKQEYLYCLEVEEDHSFIAGGIVHHNCR
ncbi:MAG: hypothetical protein WD607_04935, partial [Candidatus Paceibacterota bacterium]